MSAASAPSGVPPAPPSQGDAGAKSKWFTPLVFLLTTLATSVIGSQVGYHYAMEQQTTTNQQADVKKFEEQTFAIEKAIRLYMAGLNKGSPKDDQREAVADAIQVNFRFAETLLPLLKVNQQNVLNKYRDRLVQVSSRLPESKDIVSTFGFAQAVSYMVDDRIAAARELRLAVGLPETPKSEVTTPAIENTF